MIKTYTFYPIDSKMYIAIENRKALIVDPCIATDAIKYMQEEDVEEIMVVLTHEHYDHISGVNWLRDNFKNICVFCSKACADSIDNPCKNLSEYWEILFAGKDEKTQEYIRSLNIQPYSCKADKTFEGEYEFTWQSHKIVLKEMPGHSKGSICILVDDRYLFSGDTLVTGHETILRLPGGSKKDFADITLPYFQTLDRDIMVYPGHGKPQKLKKYFK